MTTAGRHSLLLCQVGSRKLLMHLKNVSGSRMLSDRGEVLSQNRILCSISRDPGFPVGSGLPDHAEGTPRLMPWKTKIKACQR